VTSSKLVGQTIGTPSIARLIVEKAASLSRAMLGVPVLQNFIFPKNKLSRNRAWLETDKNLPFKSCDLSGR
jgi:hypothetical protein